MLTHTYLKPGIDWLRAHYGRCEMYLIMHKLKPDKQAPASVTSNLIRVSTSKT